ncbi:helix-turn-helix domain-containing protein [Sediminispirochaeta smaragdinae]|uniref:Helix-turn-helix domain-containing protein n=1 Tax=Sediminispirochaeta smaragdinae (strain DSM 11293 / JCM 15392 / SEBR 4228) TaxID=573413 RepID=E1R1Z9_SEDSS|nr:helix-turn-helix domain-containing protein [Sediminispirochaeta smaragdinae]ADK81884.1 hypothetical protein Spirs_2781 [Sediminispirochaeta smaragdinae DSM 11293]
MDIVNRNETITFDDSIEGVTKTLAEALAMVVSKGIKPVVIEKQDTIVDVKGAAEYLKVSTATIHRMTKDREIPYFKVKGNNRFSIKELEKYISNQMIHPNKRRK